MKRDFDRTAERVATDFGCDTRCLQRCGQQDDCHCFERCSCGQGVVEVTWDTLQASSKLPEPTNMVLASVSATEPISATLSNDSTHPCELWWHDYQGAAVSYGVMLPGETKIVNTYVTHPWTVTSNYGPFEFGNSPVWNPTAADNGTTISVTSERGENTNAHRWRQTDYMVTIADKVNLNLQNNSGVVAQRQQYSRAGTIRATQSEAVGAMHRTICFDSQPYSF